MYKVGVKTLAEWKKRAERDLDGVSGAAARIPALKRLGIGSASVSLVGERKMAALNYLYRRKRRPTDVLSFPVPKDFRRQGMLGELVICLPVLKRQARELEHSPEIELKVLLVHGFLHLLGFDHEKGAAAAKRMEAMERKLLGRLRSRSLIERSHSCKDF